MNKDDLIKLKNDIAKLSDEEKRLRDIHLRALATGKLQGPPVGIPSIDKTWLKNFDETVVGNFSLDKMTMYQYMKQNVEKYPSNATTISFLGKKITNKELLRKIDDVTRALLALGVKKNDKVLLLLPSCPEAVYTVYALNRIGAVACPIEPMIKENNLDKTIEDIKPNLIISLDMCLPLVNKYCDSKKRKVVSLSPVNSALFPIKMIFKCKEKGFTDYSYLSNFNNFIEWNDFLADGSNYNGHLPNECSDDNLAAIIYTGGTTGRKKGVKLSNYSINAMVHQHLSSGIPFQRGQKFLDFLPPFIVYGLVMAIHMPISLGFETLMVPMFKPKDFPELILKSKSEYIFASPVHYEELLKYTAFHDVDLSFIKLPVSGGDSMTMEFEEKVNEELVRCKANCKLGQGLGMSEAGGTIAVPFPGKVKLGSVGLPFHNTLIGIFEPGTDIEKGFYESGELCFSGPSIMQEYLNNKEETDLVLRKHSDGSLWLHTQDIAHIDEDGYLFFSSRIKRIINRGGLKVYPQAVEKVILKNKNVRNCVCVGVYNAIERHVPIVHLILNDDSKKEETLKELVSLCEQELETESIPYGYVIWDELPYTLNGKVDALSLEYTNEDDIIRTTSINHDKIKTKKLS